MTTPVSQSPSPFAFDAVRVGRPVVSGGFARWSSDLAFVLGHCVHVAGTVVVHDRPAGRNALKGLGHTVHVPYARSPGAQVARLVVELHPGAEDDGTQTLTTSLPSGAAWLTGGAGGLDGTVVHRNPPPGLSAPSEIVGWIDVSGCDPTSTSLVVSVASSPNSKGYGIRRASLTEVPVSSFDVTSSEAGWDAAATRPGRLVVDGGASSPRGTQRLFHLLDLARTQQRHHLVVGDVETADATGSATTPHWYRETASAGAIAWGINGAPHWYLTPRVLAGTTVPFKHRVRYRTSGGVACAAHVYLEAGSLVGGVWTPAAAASAQTLTLPATSGAWAWAETDVTCPVAPLVRVWWEATGPGGPGLLSLATLALLERHT